MRPVNAALKEIRHHVYLLLKEHGPSELLPAVTDHITLTSEPGRWAQLTIDWPAHSRGLDQHLQQRTQHLRLSLNQNGTIEISGTLCNGHAMRLPHPDPDQERRHTACLNTLDTIRTAIVSETTALVERHAKDEPWFQQMVMHNVTMPLASWTKYRNWPEYRTLTGTAVQTALEDAVRTLLSPEPWRQGHSGTGNTHLHRYNGAVLTIATQRGLDQTNPGISVWDSRHRPHPWEDPQHPGQIVKTTKAQLQKAGMNPRYWKRAAAMSKEAASIITERPSPQFLTALILNAVGETGVELEPEDANRLINLAVACRRKDDTIQRPLKKDGDHERNARANLQKLLALSLRQTPVQTAKAKRQLIHTADYLAHMNQHGLPIRSTTPGGLEKTVEAWHDGFRRQNLVQAAKNRIASQHGFVRGWNSLVPKCPIELEGTAAITAVPLTNELQLAEEGYALAHCVGSYHRLCQAGRSRIFSLRRGGNILATTELVDDRGNWKVNQTSGYHNDAPPPEAAEAARSLAILYNQAWHTTNPDHRHDAWMEHQQTLERRPA